MALHYDTNGLRWLAVSAYGRTLMVFDLCDLTNPLNVRNEIAKNIVSSLDWPLMWENFVMALGSALQNSKISNCNIECSRYILNILTFIRWRKPGD